MAGTGVQHMPRNVAVYISFSRSVKSAPQNWQHKETIQAGLDCKYLQTVKLNCNNINSASGLNTIDSESWSHEVVSLSVWKGCSFLNRHISAWTYFFTSPPSKSKYLKESSENKLVFLKVTTRQFFPFISSVRAGRHVGIFEIQGGSEQRFSNWSLWSTVALTGTFQCLQVYRTPHEIILLPK